MKTTYVIELKHTQGRFIVTYEKGVMYQQTNETNLDVHGLAHALSLIPLNEEALKLLAKGKNNIYPVAQDLSFEAFWKKYNYKVGKKTRAEVLWKCMPDELKQLAMAGVDAYNKWLMGRSVEKAYPETYLAQRRWENEF
jgi:hypothetical protein